MGSSSGGKKKYINFRSRQRANMSFFIVVMFFAVFGIIVFTEIFLIDERGRGAGVLVRHGSLAYHHRSQDRADYDEDLRVNIAKCDVMNGGSYIPLPKWVENKKAIINVKNLHDNYCFAYSLMCKLHPVEKHPQRVTKYPNALTSFNFDGIEFPVKVTDLKKFERQNPEISVNVYGVDGSKICGPIYFTQEKKNTHVNLLLLQDDDTWHYCFIKDLSRLCSSQLNKSRLKKFICDRCLAYFHELRLLVDHEELCKNFDSVHLKLPEEENKILKFKAFDKKEFIPFVVFADFESLLMPMDTCQPDDSVSYTMNYAKHEPYAVAMQVVCNFDAQYDRFTLFRGKDCVERFLDHLKELCGIVEELLDHNEEMKFPSDLNQSMICHICKKKLDPTKDKIVKDHNHFTGVFRGLCHNSDDYISIRVGGGGAANFEDTVGALLMGRPAVIPVIDDDPVGPQSSKVVTETQLPPYPVHPAATQGSWQNVNGTRYKFFVFSAFFDNRKGQRSIRVIGATKTRGPERVWCRMWYKTTDNNVTTHVSRTVQAKIKVIRENWNLKYSACFVMCPLLANQTVPAAVSIVGKVKSPPTNLLTVINNYNETAAKPANNFAVCIKPLHFDYNRALQILEFIELNRIMGVEHFTFYNHTIGSQVGCILQDYVDRGLVTLLPWQLNMVSQKEIRTEGLFAALNDCLYRSMYKYSHVLLIDLDEYIIPRNNDSLPQLIEYLNNRMNTRTTGSYSFQNAFFYLQWGDDDSVYDLNDSVAAGLVTLKKTRRRSKLHPHKQRSKYICRPELVVEAGNHFVWEFIPGHGTLNVPADAAILHHYRICEFGGDDCIKTASTVDTTAFKYKNKLVDGVRERFGKFKDKCELRELPPPPTRVFSKLMNILKPKTR